MKTTFLLFTIAITLLVIPLNLSEPSFNGTDPGCSSSGCHSLSDGDVSVMILNNLEVEVTLTGVDPGEKVAGELVDGNGTVVDVMNATDQNPFILTAPIPGNYIVNAGYKKPSRNWDSTLVSLSVTDISNLFRENNPSTFELYGNYPNPFNPTTTITYSIPIESLVTIKIYSTLGEEVKELVNETQSIGSYEVTFDATSLPSGTYFYRLQAGNTVQLKKMLLMK